MKKCIIVPEEWFKTLLEKTLKCEEVRKNFKFGDESQDNIYTTFVQLMGYAKSAEHIIKHNEKIEK